MIIAIAGATGLTGSFCLNDALENPKVSKVITIGRKNTGLRHKKLEEILLTNHQWPHPIKADAFICCLGTTIKKAGTKAAFSAVDHDLPLYLAQKLRENGCSIAAVISAMGANSDSRTFYFRTKGLMEEGMKAIGFESLAILRPSLISGPRKEQRLGETIGYFMLTAASPLLIGHARHYKTIKASTIAKALVKAVIEHKPGVSIYLSGEIQDLAANEQERRNS